MFKVSAAVALTISALAPAAAYAQASDPAAQTVESLDRALLDSMRSGKSESVEQRFRGLQPVVSRTFNLQAMIRVAAGPSAFDKMSAADKAALVSAFSRFTAASYAHNFSSYNGQKFVVDRVDTRLPDKLVRTELQSPGGSSVVLSYRMRSNGGGWKIIDVYFNGTISSLTQQSADFASTVNSGGAAALIRKLNAQSDQLLK